MCNENKLRAILRLLIRNGVEEHMYSMGSGGGRLELCYWIYIVENATGFRKAEQGTNQREQ